MTVASPNELAGIAMRPTWLALEPVRVYDKAIHDYLIKRLPPNAGLDVESWNFAAILVQEFNRTWPHRVPKVWELVLADRAGRLQETVDQINKEFREGAGKGTP